MISDDIHDEIQMYHRERRYEQSIKGIVYKNRDFKHLSLDG